MTITNLNLPTRTTGPFIMTDSTGEQIGEQYDTREDAELALEALLGSEQV